MTVVRLYAALPAVAFAVLAACMTAVGGVPVPEAAWAAASVAVALLPSGWVAPAGWRRRGVEALILPAAFALVMLGDPTLRRMVLPPLLLLPALAAQLAAAARAGDRVRPLLFAALAIAARSACGLGLVGVPWWRTALVLLSAAAAAWAAARLAGRGAGVIAALLAGTLPLETAPRWVLAGLLAAAAAAAVVAIVVHTSSDRLRRWWGGVVAVALVVASLAPWGGIGVHRALPAARWGSAAATFAALAVTPFLPAAAAGAVWLATTVTLGTTQPPTPDHAAIELTAGRPVAVLPTSSGGPYAVDLSLVNGATVPTGTAVATVTGVGTPVILRAGVDAAEWAHERADVRPIVAHTLPSHPVWRPTGVGRAAVWGVAGRTAGFLPKGVQPHLLRDPHLPSSVGLVAAAAGTEAPTPPRNWPLPAWILAAAAAVAVLQLVSRTWNAPAAWLPWAMLTAGSLLARLAVEPLRLLAERHSVDIALAAVLAAWLPVARAWLPRRRAFLTAAAFLVPLALATPHLFPPGGDEQYHLILLRSLAQDHDLDLRNNFDLQDHPENHIYMTGKVFLHSPVLAALLLPGFLVGKRAGALVLLAIMGSVFAALLARRAEKLGCPPRRVALLVTLLVISYPLTTFSTQIWVEVPGAVAAMVAVALMAATPPRRLAAVADAAIATAMKARLGLITLPLLVSGWWRRRLRGSDVARVTIALAVALAIGLGVGWVFLGSPLGMRRLPDLVPRNLTQPVLSVGGLLFDPAGGLAAAAPLLLLALFGLGALWRRGSAVERALLAGGAATLLALLHSTEWYGGGSPPARYLVPLLPIFALAGAMVAAVPRAWRTLVPLVLPPAMLTSWTYVTRPHLAFNSGTGRYWLGDSLAVRFHADARHLFPSFLTPSLATLVVPLVAIVVVAALLLLWNRARNAVRGFARSAVALWLVCAAALVVTLHVRHDAVIEVEDPQVTHLGGRLEPPLLTFGRYLYPNGWQVGTGEGVVVPLNLAAHVRLALEGWLQGSAREGADLVVSWDSGPSERVHVSGAGERSVAIPDPAGGGRHRLRIVLEAPPGGEAVLDRLVVGR
jgi:hypothetical protein